MSKYENLIDVTVNLSISEFLNDFYRQKNTGLYNIFKTIYTKKVLYL